jgi:predicted lipid-binding transport protein (Tim44 family)
MEISTNELFALIILAIFCWKIRQSLDDAERRAKQHLHALTAPTDGGRGDHVSVSKTPSTSNADEAQKSSLASRLSDLESADRSFDAKWFVENASIAYEKIITAFAQGDRALLRALLTDDVYETFAHEIADRESRGEYVEFTFIRLKRSEIVGAGVFNGGMQISVVFDSEIVMTTRNSTGLVVAGDPRRVINTSDLWSFVKEEPGSPVWKLARTESPDEKQEGASDDRVRQVSGV